MKETLSIYFKELKNKNSTKEESLDLILKARKGDDEAKTLLISNYLLMVVKIARQYSIYNVPFSDLIGEGNIGLLTALEKFDETRGAPFSSCAQYWIKAAIIRNCMHKQGVVALPENVSELLRTGRWEGDQYRQMSIDTPNDEGNTMADTISDGSNINICEAAEEEMLLKRKITKVLGFLQERDAQIVKDYYGINDNEEEIEIEKIAEKYNLTTTRINQILRNSIKYMRITYETLPEAKTKEILIISAKYGAYEKMVDVTEKVIEIFNKKDKIKSSNKLGGDPCFGTVKKLYIEYTQNGELLKKSFNEGTFVTF